MSTINSTSSTFEQNGLSAAVVPASNRKIGHSIPCTEAQLEIWLSSKQSTEANCAYNEIATLHLSGALNHSVLETALQQLIERHDSLRSTISTDGLKMNVAETAQLQFEFKDWSELDQDEVENRRLQVLQDEACVPFDLENGPLFRTILQRVSENEHYLTLSAHHIILDGWSLAVVSRDLGFLYDQLLGKPGKELPEAMSYAEYSQRMSEYFGSDNADQDKAFWRDQFAESIPILDLPISGPRPPVKSFFARRFDHFLPAELVNSMRKLGAKSGCSIFNTLLSAFEAYVSRISGNQDFCVGIPTAGQLAMDCPDLVGHCVNMMPLRSKVDWESNFNEHLKKTRSRMLDAMEHQRFTFGEILKAVSPPRDPSRPILVPITFNVDPGIENDDLGFEGLGVSVHVEPRMFENFEWFVNGIIHKDDSIEFQVQYNTDLFTASSLRWIFDGFEEFLNQILVDPNRSLSELPILNVAQRQKVLVDWNDTSRDYQAESTLHGEFARQVQSTPDHVAVKFEDRSLTYAELDQQSNAFANYLSTNSVEQGDLVGICMNRSEKMLVVLLGILKTGAGYVPLDPAFPVDRLKYMCDHSNLKSDCSPWSQRITEAFIKVMI